MQRILLTGMSGTGKSSVVGELAARGYRAIDADSDEWSEWAPYVAIPGIDETHTPEREWVWRADRIRDLLLTEAGDLLFVAGCASNMVQFYDLFDHVVLLCAPIDVVVRRLLTRRNNSYGQHPDEMTRILGDIETVEPLLRQRATCEIDTNKPLEDVVATLLELANRPSNRPQVDGR